MKDTRFYEEFTNTSKMVSRQTVVAIAPSTIHISQGDVLYEATGSIFNRPNSPVCGTSVDQKYLTMLCKRVSEKKARKIHPNMFKYLDN